MRLHLTIVDYCYYELSDQLFGIERLTVWLICDILHEYVTNVTNNDTPRHSEQPAQVADHVHFCVHSFSLRAHHFLHPAIIHNSCVLPLAALKICVSGRGNIVGNYFAVVHQYSGLLLL